MQIDDRAPALYEFEDRWVVGLAWELTCKARLEQRGCQVTLIGAEHLYPSRTLEVLRKNNADMCGPDMLATTPDGMCYAIDAKTAMPSRNGQGHLEGLGRFTISEKALRAMENYAGAHRIPGLFVFGDDSGYVMGPWEVRRSGTRSKDDHYWVVLTVNARTISYVFGDLSAGQTEAVCEVEDLPDVA